MAILQTGQTFSSGDQVTSQKLMDIADLATFSDPADGATIIANNATYGVNGGDGKLKVKANGIGSNELLQDATNDANRAVTTNHIKDQAVTSAKLAPSAISSLMPTGTVMPFAGTTLPNSDWLFCDGSEYSETGTYSNLFSVIQSTYNTGSETASHFRVPDLRGRVIAGQDDMGGTSANTLTNAQADQLGGTLGEEEHLLTSAESGMPAHKHTVDDSNNAGTTVGSWAYGDEGDGVTESTNETNDVAAQNASSAHNNVQPTIILNYIIKT